MKVAIGLPVFNGARFLPQAIESLLAQTFDDFELIIVDNASTDATDDICRRYARQDPRIRYVRNERNLGAAANFNKVFHLADSPYFKWAAHDDLCAPEFLERCVAVLDADPSIVLTHSQTRLINEDGSFLPYDEERGAFIDSYDRAWTLNAAPQPELGASDPMARFRFILLHAFLCDEIFGVIRSAALRKTSLHRAYYGSDKVLLAELSLLGRYHEVAAPLFFRRCHPEQSSYMSIREREQWISGYQPGRFIFPQWKVFLGYFRAMGVTRLGPRQKLRGLSTMLAYATQADKLKRLLTPGPSGYLSIDLTLRGCAASTGTAACTDPAEHHAHPGNRP